MGTGLLLKVKKEETDSFIHTEMAHQVFPYKLPELNICYIEGWTESPNWLALAHRKISGFSFITICFIFISHYQLKEQKISFFNLSKKTPLIPA